jgi:hypothetical protein
VEQHRRKYFREIMENTKYLMNRCQDVGKENMEIFRLSAFGKQFCLKNRPQMPYWNQDILHVNIFE